MPGVAPTPAAPAPAAPTPAAAPAAAPPAPSASPAGERKQATALSCTLHTESAAGGALDPESLHHALSRYFELAKREVERYGGVINQFLGQGFLALFGAPITYEDHTRRAVLASLGLKQALADEDPQALGGPGAKVQLRMGIDIGTVVFGGSGSMAVGETTRVASQVMELAQPGETLITKAAGRPAWLHVRLQRATTLETPGAEPIHVYRILGQRQRPAGPLEAFARGNLSPFVGREREINVLQDLRREAMSGRGQVVGILGDAGAGKSRLLHEFRRTFDASSFTYLSGQCLSFEQNKPYTPLLSMIRRASYIAEGDSPETITNKLRESLEAIDAGAEASLPYLLRLLGVREGTESLNALEPRVIQARTFDVLRRMVLKAGQDSLVMLELEDLHWLDPTSEEFLASLVETMVATRLLMVVTYRPGYKPAWLEKSYATQITMRRLSDEDSRKLVEDQLGDKDVGEAEVNQVLEKAEGNPLFLEELARSLREGSGEASIPDTVQGVLMARIDRLPEVHKHLLQTASVLGRELSMDVLERIWDRQEPLDALLTDLKRWELLYEAGTASGTAYFFQHAMTQDVASHSLLQRRRQDLHAQVGEAIEELNADRLPEVYNRLVYHFLRANKPTKTVHYVRLFADAAAAAFAHAEAAQALRDSFEHAEMLPGDNRDREVVELALRLADSLLPLAALPETLELLERYKDRASALSDDRIEARYAFWTAHTHTYLGNQEPAAEFAHRSIEASKRSADEDIEGKACYVLGREGFWAGRFKEGVDYSRRAVVLLERSGEPWWQGQAHWVAGWNQYASGQFKEAFESVGRAYAMGQALADPRLDPSWSAGYYYATLGEFAKGIEACQRGVDDAKDPLNRSVALGFLGHAQMAAGQLDDALSSLEEAIAALEGTGMQQILGWVYVFLGEARLKKGDIEAAADAGNKALETTDGAKFLYGKGLALRLRGQIAAARGDSTAIEELEAALSLFEQA